MLLKVFFKASSTKGDENNHISVSPRDRIISQKIMNTVSFMEITILQIPQYQCNSKITSHYPSPSITRRGGGNLRGAELSQQGGTGRSCLVRFWPVLSNWFEFHNHFPKTWPIFQVQNKLHFHLHCERAYYWPQEWQQAMHWIHLKMQNNSARNPLRIHGCLHQPASYRVTACMLAQLHADKLDIV